MPVRGELGGMSSKISDVIGFEHSGDDLYVFICRETTNAHSVIWMKWSRLSQLLLLQVILLHSHLWWAKRREGELTVL